MAIYLGYNRVGIVKYVDGSIKASLKTLAGTYFFNITKAKATEIDDLTIKGNTTQQLLPSEYQQVEYIENSGTQRIDTGLIPTNSTSIDITYQALAIQGYSQYIAGARENASASVRYAINGSSSNKYWDVRFNGVTNTITATERTTNKYRSNLQLNNGNGTWTLTDLTTNTDYTLSIAGAKVPAISNLFLFAYLNLDANTHSNLRIFACKIYEAGVLVRDFIPCYRKADNEAGMYDLVDGVFYTNAGTGSFSVASDIEATPSPEQPIEIVSVGEKTTNLFDISKAENGTIYTQTGLDLEQVDRCRPTFMYLKKGQYCFSCLNNIQLGGYIHKYSTNKDTSWIGAIPTNDLIIDGTKTIRTFILDEDCFIRFVILPVTGSGVALDLNILKTCQPMLEKSVSLLDATKAETGTLLAADGGNYEATNRARTPFIPVTKGKYTISMDTRLKTTTMFFYSQPNPSGFFIGKYTTTPVVRNGKKTATFSVDQDCYMRCVFAPEDESSTTVTASTLIDYYTMISRDGTEYIPYGYQIPVNLLSENLANEQTIQQNKLIGNSANGIINDSTTYDTLYMEVKEGATYKFKNFVRADGTSLRGCFYDSNGAWVSAFEDTTATIPNGVKFVGRSFSKEATDVELREIYSTYNIYAKEPLRKINDVADVLDYKNKKVIREISVYLLTGTEHIYNAGSGFPYACVIGNNLTDYKKGSNIPVLSNEYKNVHNTEIDKTTATGTFCQYGNNWYFNYDNQTMGATEFKTLLKTKYENGNPVQVYYQLETPIEEEIESDKIILQAGTNRMEIATTLKPTESELKYWEVK